MRGKETIKIFMGRPAILVVCAHFPRWTPDSKCASKKVKKRVKKN